MLGSSLILIVIAFSTAAIIAAYMTYEAVFGPKAEVTQIAAVRGAPFDASKDDSHHLRYAHFSIFSQGQARYAFNTIRSALDVGGESWPVQFGDYHFETMEPDGQQPMPQTHVLSYVLVETPYLGLPDLHIRSQGLFDKVADVLGFEEINFESATFNDQFAVQS